MEEVSDDDVVCLATNEEKMSSLDTDIVQDGPEMAPTFIETLLAIEVGDEPVNGARVQLRMPDATRLVRRFVDSESVKSIYAYVAVSDFIPFQRLQEEVEYRATNSFNHSKAANWQGRVRSSC